MRLLQICNDIKNVLDLAFLTLIVGVVVKRGYLNKGKQMERKLTIEEMKSLGIIFIGFGEDKKEEKKEKGN